MRIAVSGSHRTAKSTLLAALAKRLPGYDTVDEPYHTMEEDGHEFSHPPSVDDFVAQLERRTKARLAVGRPGASRSRIEPQHRRHALRIRGGHDPHVHGHAVQRVRAAGSTRARLSRLYDVRNVAVADSSAFTTGPEKNPVLTSMALAARAADALAVEMRSGDL